MSAAAWPAANPYRHDWGRARAALKRLIANKEDTVAVFEIMRALTGRSIPNGYARLLRTPEGGRIAYRRAELATLLDDHDALRRLPPGSVGRRYLAFVEAQALTAGGLAQESRRAHDAAIDLEHPLAWYGRRLRDIHDLWHVLTGYGRDGLGETCVVAFSYAQTRSLGFALIALAGAHVIAKAWPDRPVRRAVWQAYRAGRRAAWLPGVDYEALLAEPLAQARRRLGIAEPTFYLMTPDPLGERALAPGLA